MTRESKLEPSGVVSLTTDFGLRDHYVAAMKAVIAGVAPAVRVVDVSHEVPAHDWRGAAYLLSAAFADFPRGSVHVVVVDPGVGSERRALAVETRAGWFLGPDNGCLEDAVRASGFARAWRIVGSPRKVSATFHGRDLFAPLAAALAAGSDASRWLEATRWRPRRAVAPRAGKDGAVRGRVVWVDRFGNLVTTVERAAMAGARRLRGVVGGMAVETFCRTYADAPAGKPFFLWGSGERLEVSVREGSAAGVLEVGAGCAVRVWPC